MSIANENEIGKKYPPLKTKDTAFMHAGDLVDAVIDFVGATPDKKMWNEESLHSNPPRLYRIRQIHALFDAFGLRAHGELGLEGFFSGDFVSEDNTRYESLLDMMEVMYRTSGQSRTWLESFKRNQHSVSVRSVFSYLLDFIVSFKKLGLSQGLVGHDAVASSFAYGVTRSVLNSIDPVTINNVKHILTEIIDPEKQELSIRELVEKYNYPDLDLKDVDADFW